MDLDTPAPRLTRHEVQTAGQIMDDSVVGLLRLIHDDIDALHRRQTALEAALARQQERETECRGAVMSAFPCGPQKHREAHEADQADAAAKERFLAELKLEMAKKGLWAVLLVIVGLIVAGAALKLGVAPK